MWIHSHLAKGITGGGGIAGTGMGLCSGLGPLVLVLFNFFMLFRPFVC